MDDGKLEHGIYQSLSHWGLFDGTLLDGMVTIHCDSDGLALGHEVESINEVLPLLVVNYENRGQLIVMGDHVTGLISRRVWVPEIEGAVPPADEFTSGMEEVRAPNATRH